jgi:hypothetical protein
MIRPRPPRSFRDRPRVAGHSWWSCSSPLQDQERDRAAGRWIRSRDRAVGRWVTAITGRDLVVEGRSDRHDTADRREQGMRPRRPSSQLRSCPDAEAEPWSVVFTARANPRSLRSTLARSPPLRSGPSDRSRRTGIPSSSMRSSTRLENRRATRWAEIALRRVAVGRRCHWRSIGAGRRGGGRRHCLGSLSRWPCAPHRCA